MKPLPISFHNLDHTCLLTAVIHPLYHPRPDCVHCIINTVRSLGFQQHDLLNDQNFKYIHNAVQLNYLQHHKFPYLNVVILLLSFFFKPAFRSPNSQLNLVQLLLKPSNPCFHALWLHFKKLWIAHWMKINFFLSKANMMCHLAFIQHWKLNLMYELSHTYLYIDVQTISIV